MVDHWLFGEVPERLNGLVSKTSRGLCVPRGFESLPLRQNFSEQKFWRDLVKTPGGVFDGSAIWEPLCTPMSLKYC